MAVGKVFMRTVMDEGVEVLGRIVEMHGVDGPGWYVVEVIRVGGPRAGERRGWGVLDVWDDGGRSMDVYETLEEAQAAMPDAH
nr:hypothetical protein [uncultured Nocardioides sp.]